MSDIVNLQMTPEIVQTGTRTTNPRGRRGTPPRKFDLLFCDSCSCTRRFILQRGVNAGKAIRCCTCDKIVDVRVQHESLYAEIE